MNTVKHISQNAVISAAELEKNAHAAFKRCRATHPFALLESGGYIVLRHKDISTLLKDPRMQATQTAMPIQGGITKGALFDIFDQGMLTANGHLHERRRLGMSKTLARQVLTGFRPYVRKSAEMLLERHCDDGMLELGKGFASVIPVMALAHMIGVANSDIPSFLQDIYEMNAFFRPNATLDTASVSEKATIRVRHRIATLAEDRRNRGSDDFLSEYLAEADSDDQISSSESLMQIVQLIIGGTESVRTAIVAQTANLLENFEQWQAVCEDPDLIPGAVAESLRYEPAIAGVVRITAEDIELDGWTLPAGQLVILSFLSALRDDRVFQDPDTFDILRPVLEGPHLAFGGGAHKCVAEALGRIELEETLAALSERYPKLKLVKRPVFSGHMFVRSSSECWVNW